MDAKPALLLIPGQTESWWGYEAAINILAADFQVYAVEAFDYVSRPDVAHAMHEAQPERFSTVVRDWAKKLPVEVRRRLPR